MSSETLVAELIPLLRAADIERYLLQRGWTKQVFPRPEVICFEGVPDDRGKPIVLSVPSSERFADFAVRVQEVVNGLALIERRSPVEILREAVGAPTAIVPTEITIAGLALTPSGRSKLNPLLAAADTMLASIDVGTGNLFDCAAEIAKILLEEESVTGPDESRKSAIWSICRKVLGLGGRHFRAEASSNGLWDSARKGDLEDWLDRNTARNPPPVRGVTARPNE